jgi:hypothetical protein
LSPIYYLSFIALVEGQKHNFATNLTCLVITTLLLDNLPLFSLFWGIKKLILFAINQCFACLKIVLIVFVLLLFNESAKVSAKTGYKLSNLVLACMSNTS